MRGNHRRRGVILIYVLFILGMIGWALVVMTAGSRELALTVRRGKSDAYRAALVESARAWVTAHPDAPDGAVELDTSALAIPESKVTIDFAGGACRSIRLQYRCPFMRKIVNAAIPCELERPQSADAVRAEQAESPRI